MKLRINRVVFVANWPIILFSLKDYPKSYTALARKLALPQSIFCRQATTRSHAELRCEMKPDCGSEEMIQESLGRKGRMQRHLQHYVKDSFFSIV